MYQRSTTAIFVLHSWGQFMKIRDALETSSSHGGVYDP
ncbi:Protein argonaute 4 -like protein [Gossypium arboreum]|uniref:Protein argonaute 4-like protein n=1 Tax=Gossypium arboreum TaxID=29729 RepID=A0A0B0Q0V4_GOSAR|nr:Protein argonaute 4 -like protein [Gossypium arboreum]